MKIPYDEILGCVRKSIAPQKAFKELIDVGKSQLKSPLWDAIPTPDTEADVTSAATWLQESFSKYPPTGVYLGMDTVNENDGKGKNVEIGMTDVPGPLPLELEWIYDGFDYGENHLIRGLYEIHKGYDALDLQEPQSLLADYVFYLGYSGIVLAAALDKMQVRWESLFVWGFHSGDLAFLARSTPAGITRLATLGDE
jgi:hypothetical protein